MIVALASEPDASTSALLRAGQVTLSGEGVESARLEAELLLASVLGVPRLDLCAYPERPLSEAQIRAYQSLLERRGRGEPNQYLTGVAGFCGLDFLAAPGALIPRPETETLALAVLDAIASDGVEAPTVLDYGTGSGCVAIAVAMKTPRARVLAVDQSADALEIARTNARRHGVDDRVAFLQASTARAACDRGPADVFVSNPPYIPSADIAGLQREIVDHEPRLALDGGADGLRFYREFAEDAPALLRSGGRLLVEFGDGQGDAVREIFSAAPWTEGRVLKDLGGEERVFCARVSQGHDS